jgi:hypothetical protein
MRLRIFDTKAALSARVIAQLVRFFDGFSPDIVKMFLYRKEFFGRPWSELTHQVMRGPSGWTVGERETFPAVVSRFNQCVF